MQLKTLLLTSFLGLTALLAKATVIYVDAANTGAQNGTSWSGAFSDFQTGINFANTGDSLWVANGTYNVAADTSFVMKEGVKIFGGFLNTDTDFEQRNWSANLTTLKGNLTKSVINNTANLLTPAAVLDGFTISYGGGPMGGGMNNNQSSPTVINCTFIYNSATTGGGMGNTKSEPRIINCIFAKNSATNFGGLYNNEKSPILINCTITGNLAMLSGGAMGNIYSAPKLSNTIIWANYTTIFNQGGGGTYDHCLVDYYFGSNNPFFVDTAANDFRVTANSPAINKGSNAALPVGTTFDIGHKSRVHGDTVDIGAHEYDGPAVLKIDPLQNKKITFTVSPNPATDYIVIAIHNDDKLRSSKAVLFDAAGSAVRTVRIESRNQKVSLVGLTPGTYLLKMEDGIAVKVVKK